MKILKIIIIANLLISFFACDKDKENGLPTGNIVGFINLVDEEGNYLVDESDVVVSIEDENISATSTVKGRFELVDVPAGTYDVSYSKTGYGTCSQSSFQFIGGHIPAMLSETTLYELPSNEIKSLDISYEDDNDLVITAEISETNQCTIVTYLGDSKDVSNTNYKYYSKDKYYTSWGTLTKIDQSIYLNEASYSKGDKIYLVIYFLNPYERYSYTSSKKATNAISLTLE